MKHLATIICILFIVTSCTEKQVVTIERINTEEEAGNFTDAKHLIDLYMADNNLSETEIYDLNWRKDRMNRIALDFNKDKESVIKYISKYYPDVNNEMLARWETEKALESLVIDGEKKYFSRAASNLFRLDKDAIVRKKEVDTLSANQKENVLNTHLPNIVNTLAGTAQTQVSPVGMTVQYEITLQPNVVLDGEIVRCWLPYPREDERRQTNVKLISANDENYIISPEQYAHRTLYMQKTAKKDEALKFAITFSYESAAEWFDLDNKEIREYDTNSDSYKKYTAERLPHIAFTDSIKAISERIVGNEKDPYQKVKKIFKWVDETFPWAGAREYSTIPNIPAYVLDSKHGDCGQVTLLFITLARYNGIPARWQSGFMMHPGELNLHDWGEYYIEGIGWIPIDQSFGLSRFSDDDRVFNFYSNGMDAYRWIVNNDYSRPLFPEKIYPRSETVDFQRGELEWRGGNIYFDKWNWDFNVSYD
ncbi:transglutaminase-like domain-containing protein [Massilibacteroides sp.]|uniref:transglutaminase-like domain-containing protein n=1 Tax=Massilibacteroides sp. TaxID=2034766 RepID=UPI002631A986|nr:transglutaminase-like domain-containing protein [Massilibacteroides sp.]MDD4514457.1 transglutaminase-like domain-containing protein [Massilibacteroides sp.]